MTTKSRSRWILLLLLGAMGLLWGHLNQGGVTSRAAATAGDAAGGHALPLKRVASICFLAAGDSLGHNAARRLTKNLMYQVRP